MSELTWIPARFALPDTWLTVLVCGQPEKLDGRSFRLTARLDHNGKWVDSWSHTTLEEGAVEYWAKIPLPKPLTDTT